MIVKFGVNWIVMQVPLQGLFFKYDLPDETPKTKDSISHIVRNCGTKPMKTAVIAKTGPLVVLAGIITMALSTNNKMHLTVFRFGKVSWRFPCRTSRVLFIYFYFRGR